MTDIAQPVEPVQQVIASLDDIKLDSPTDSGSVYILVEQPTHIVLLMAGQYTY